MSMINKHVPVAATFSKDAKFWGKDFEIQALGSYGPNGTVSRDESEDIPKYYIDWVSSLGANFLGYEHNEITQNFKERLKEQVELGICFSLPHKMEYSVASKLVHLLGDVIPGFGYDNQVRWIKTGSDACELAIRLARAYTKKTDVISYGYHGQGADFVSMTPPAWGIPSSLSEYMIPLEYNSAISLYSNNDNDKVAAVIVEHPLEEPKSYWYESIRDFCDTHKALFIMDEVVTGIRYGQGGACERYGIKPDIICMGKALGNGLPIAAVIARNDIMSTLSSDSPVFMSTTNGGDALSLAAADYVLDVVREGSYLDHLNYIGKALKAVLNSYCTTGRRVIGDPVRSLTIFDNEYERAYFIQEMAKKGILMNRPNFPNLGHSIDQVNMTTNAAFGILNSMNSLGVDMIEEIMKDKLPTVLFRNR